MEEILHQLIGTLSQYIFTTCFYIPSVARRISEPCRLCPLTNNPTFDGSVVVGRERKRWWLVLEVDIPAKNPKLRSRLASVKWPIELMK